MSTSPSNPPRVRWTALRVFRRGRELRGVDRAKVLDRLYSDDALPPGVRVEGRPSGAVLDWTGFVK